MNDKSILKTNFIRGFTLIPIIINQWNKTNITLKDYAWQKREVKCDIEPNILINVAWFRRIFSKSAPKVAWNHAVLLCCTMPTVHFALHNKHCISTLTWIFFTITKQLTYNIYCTLHCKEKNQMKYTLTLIKTNSQIFLSFYV